LADVVVFGTGELGRLARFFLDNDSPHRVVAYSVDDKYLGSDREVDGVPLVGFEALPDSYSPDEVLMFVAVGYRRVNRGRAEAYERVRRMGYRLVTYVNSSAIVAPGVELGDNCFVFERVVLQPFVRVGNDTILWSGAVIAHDTTLGDHCFVAPMASISGNVTVGDYAFIGNNATVRDGVTIAASTVVGAGALIKRDTRPEEIYSPARTLEHPDRHSSELDSL
jgi:sugar O-acyltransferase (sialic acid O-acetyltransferase NeuD family)